MPTEIINGLTIAYDDVGEGQDTLLLIHGHPFDRSMWRPQLAAVREAGWRALVPDLRGYGESTVIPGKTRLEDFADDLAMLLDRMGIEHLVLGGLSMGGQIVMEFARRFPNRVRGVVLVATFPQSETEEGKRNRNAMADRLQREGMHLYADEVLPKMLAARSIEALPAVAEHVLAMMRRTNPDGAVAALRGRAERSSYDDTLAALCVPSLVVVGSEDAFTTKADAERMCALMKGSVLVLLQDVGHMPNLEDCAAFNFTLTRFLNSLGTTEPAIRA